MSRCLVALLVMLVSLASCTTTQRPVNNPHPRLTKDTPEGMQAVEGVYASGADTEGDPGVVENEFYVGESDRINEEAARRRPTPMAADGEIVLNFEGESIQSVVHTILGEVLGETFVIGPGVSGQVTFATSKPVSRDQLMPILELLLRWNGATLVWHADRYHVLPVEQAIPGHTVPRLGDVEKVRGYEVQAVPLEYISPTEMAKILEPYVRPNAIVNVDVMRGMIFLAGTREELMNYLQTVEIFDVDWLAGMSVGIYPLMTVDVESITTELTAIFGMEEGSPLAGLFRFVPLERLGSVMVITPHEKYLEKAEEWITRLDRGAAGGGVQLYVYRVKNLEAQVLSGYLSQLFAGQSLDGGRDNQQTNLAPGLEPVTMGSVSDFNNNRNQANNAGFQGNRRNNRGGGSTTIETEEGVIRITAVEETNSLLIQATQSQYASLQAAIERIDEEPLQVLIESQVMDVALNDTLQYGVSWFLSNNAADIPADAGRVLDTVEIIGSASVFNFSDIISGGKTFIEATVAALDSVTDVRSLAAPSLVVRNNSTATITVGDQVPIQSSSINTGGTGNVVSSAQYVSTGVTLNVTPRINPGGLVYMDISQEVSRPGEVADPETNPNPPISNKSVTSQVAVQSGQTIFLGGLIQEQESASSGGLPYLSRIPGIGGIFGRKSNTKLRSETIVMITPTVLENSNDLRNVTDDLRDEFIRVRPIEIHTILDNEE
ncbi:type II secretion system protein GspD [Marinihelvus fidelis]|uniref:Type II secretion system protein GspD n=1 Tax=Marinihelvus fidelis TaxID=2613842 RepID=A0A5N0TAA7_9GAMM|nr:type II secretion system secretin GspD [Marinihelvus fidelis]KAA9130766.1 type II secretion system protein GspD [Marinihelvus fidelis]